MANKKNELLEVIQLTQSPLSFSRISANSVDYYHWHQCLEILYVEQGFGIAVVDNQQYTMKPGRLFIFPPFKLHKITIEKSQKECYKRTIIHLDHVMLNHFLHDFPSYSSRLQSLAHPDHKSSVFDLSEIKETIELLFHLYDSKFQKNGSNLEHIASLMLQILTFLPLLSEPSDHINEPISIQIMQWIEDNYHQKLGLMDLSQSLKLSNSYLSRRFKFETGVLITQYLLTRRIKQACELLRYSNVSIKEIAEQTGFSDYSYFITSFKKAIGKTPLQYRKNKV